MTEGVECKQPWHIMSHQCKHNTFVSCWETRTLELVCTIKTRWCHTKEKNKCFSLSKSWIGGKKKEKRNGLCNNEIKVSPRIVNKLRIWKNKYNELNHHCQQVTKHNKPPNPPPPTLTPSPRISNKRKRNPKNGSWQPHEDQWQRDQVLGCFFFSFWQPQALALTKFPTNMMHLMLLSCKSSVTRKKTSMGVDQSPGPKHRWCRCTYKYTRI
jgi:hypothetical protein